ncbi:sugar MFS transporter [Parafilimonas sp.]|uniref:sugar MFS transporter n=1 Tax=Parafilimonas sp. TaxID=1969739 RepID=UPI003F7D5A80
MQQAEEYARPIEITAKPQSGTSKSIFIIGILFFIFGFVTWVNSTLIPYLQIACELNTSQAVWVTFAFYISYAVMAFPSSWVINKVGFKNGMMYGLLVMATGALIFIPAAQQRTFGLFLTGLFIIGIGLALLQTASNPYITILGPIESAAKRMSIMGICNKGAGALAPLIMGAILLKDMNGFEANLATLNPADKAAKLDQLASQVIMPYIVLAIVLVLLAIMIRLSSLPNIQAEEDETTNEKGTRSIFSYTYLFLGFITLFLYVGVEVMAGDIIQVYGKEINIPLDIAKHFTTYTMIAMLVSYLLGIALIPKYISQEKSLRIAAVLGIIFSLGAIFTSGYTSITFIVLLGFANAPVWPALWPLAIDGLGKHIKTGSALLIVGIAGGAILPKLWAIIGEHVGLQKAFWIMVPCYLFILYYAISGNKIGKRVK